MDTLQQLRKQLDLFGLLVIAAGTLVVSRALVFLQLGEIDIFYGLVFVVTITCSARLIVRIPGVKGEITVSDTFIFLTLLQYGESAAVLLAFADGLAASIRIARRPLPFAFNPAVMSCATFASYELTRLCWGIPKEVTAKGFSGTYLIMISTLALVQYLANSGLAAIRYAFKTHTGIIQTWMNGFLWTSITYVAGASAAGLIAQMVRVIGIWAVISVIPIIAVVYFTYRIYLKNVEVSQEQAEQAQNHVKELSHHIAEQERIANVLREREEQFRSAFDHAAGMALVSLDGRWLKVNQSLCLMLGYPAERLLSSTYQQLTHPDDLSNDISQLQLLVAGNILISQIEKRYEHSSGSDLWVLQSASIVRDADGQPSHFIFQLQDVTERKQAEEKIHHAAFHDSLTGLPNRILLTDRLSLAVERAKRTRNYQFAVLFIDLDRFKIINDSLGHQYGDLLLIQVAERLRACVRKVDSVARLGGDEFAILLDGTEGVENAAETASRIQEVLSIPFDLAGQEVFISGSIGIAFSTTGYDRPEDILRDSDTAMYRAKANGKARHEVFDQTMHTRMLERLQLESDLRHAIERHEITVYYQPIIDLATARISGFEALARWTHPTRGPISPVDFVPLAEETGLIVQLGMSVLRDACMQTAAWQAKFPSPMPLTVSINLSVRQFREPDLVDKVSNLLRETGIEPKWVRLEITESLLMDNLEKSAETLAALKALGVQLSLDDFGTGYSSLSYLHRFPFDFLKVDRSFVMRMEQDASSRQIVETIVILAEKLGMKVIAEGVEKQQQVELLRIAGCPYGQGFYFSRPCSSADMEQTLLATARNSPFGNHYTRDAQAVGNSGLA